jgi:hypothetical protein
MISKEIFLEKAGTLEKKITEYEQMYVTYLKISGCINSKDFDVVDNMCTCWCDIDEDDNHTIKDDESPFLTVLDLGDCVMEGEAILPEFTYYSKLEEIVLPKNLVSTGSEWDGTFENSERLKKVVVPETLEEFAHGTFANCEKLQDINFPNRLKCIGSFAFTGCNMFKSIKIGGMVHEVGHAAFSSCKAMEKFEVDETNKHFSVVDGVLFNKDKTMLVAFPCGYKSNHYTVRQGVETIEYGAFLGAQIESITFPSSLKIIGGWAFRLCDKIQTLDIPDSVTEIGESAFGYCSALKKVKLSNQITVLRERTFSGCDSLKEIDIPSSVKIIEGIAFAWTSNLEKLILHDGIEEFNDDLKLTNIKEFFIPKTVKKNRIGTSYFRFKTEQSTIHC